MAKKIKKTASEIIAELHNRPMRTYVSLFSSAGVGCFGFKQNGYECIATCELLNESSTSQQ